MGTIIAGGVGVVVVAFLVFYYYAVTLPKQRRLLDEARAAPPAVAFETPTIAGLDGGTALTNDFDSLRTFDDVAKWDRLATEFVSALEAGAEQLVPRVASARVELDRYIETTTDAPHIKAARVEKSEDVLRVAERLLKRMAELHEILLERVDMTPDNAKEQRALLKSLKEEKKELQITKKETRAAMTAVRREARIAHVEASPSAWAGRYTRTAAAQERRNIRRLKESALAPHEDEMAAIDRQLLTLERRIAWVQRFGDDDS